MCPNEPTCKACEGSARDICEGRHQGNEASQAAHQRSQQGSKTQRVWCLKHIRRAGKRGLTNHELADLATANSSNGPVEVHRITPRTSELKRDGHIRQSIRQPFRANAAGSRCTVLVAVEHLT